MSPIGFYIKKVKQNYDLESLEEKKKFLLLLLEALKYYSDNVERDFYLKEISRELDIERDMVYLEFSKIRMKREVREQVNIEKEYTASEFAIGHILVDPKYRLKIQQGLIFDEDYDEALMKILDDKNNLANLDIDMRDRYNAISLKIDDMNTEKTAETVERELDKLIKKLNTEVYKIKRDTYLKNEQHAEYVALLKIAKENNLK
jgi:DNA primase